MLMLSAAAGEHDSYMREGDQAGPSPILVETCELVPNPDLETRTLADILDTHVRIWLKPSSEACLPDVVSRLNHMFERSGTASPSRPTLAGVKFSRTSAPAAR